MWQSVAPRARLIAVDRQMIRRKRSFESIEVNCITLEEKEQERKVIAKNITAHLVNEPRLKPDDGRGA